MEVDFVSVNKGFSAQSAHYDHDDEINGVLIWMRSVVRKHILSYLKSGNKILELNAGTGIDASFFNSKGFEIHATDLSDGMISEISRKISIKESGGKFTCQQLSYTNIDQVEHAPFDYVYSNFGGLNCIPDLREVTRHFPSILKPGAYVTFVIMPPVCPWEIGLMLKGNFKRAFRRFKRGGVMAHLEGAWFKTYYFTPSDVLKAFGKDFRKVSLQGLGCFSPPPHKVGFPVQHPALFEKLTKADEKLSYNFPFNSWADHFILTVQFCPAVK